MSKIITPMQLPVILFFSAIIPCYACSESEQLDCIEERRMLLPSNPTPFGWSIDEALRRVELSGNEVIEWDSTVKRGAPTRLIWSITPDLNKITLVDSRPNPSQGDDEVKICNSRIEINAFLDVATEDGQLSEAKLPAAIEIVQRNGGTPKEINWATKDSIRSDQIKGEISHIIGKSQGKGSFVASGGFAFDKNKTIVLELREKSIGNDSAEDPGDASSTETRQRLACYSSLPNGCN